MVSPTEALATEWILYVVSVGFLALRLYVRTCLQGQLSLSDFLIIFAMVCMTYTRAANTVLLAWDLPTPSPQLSPTAIMPANSTGNGQADSLKGSLTHILPELVPKERIVFTLLYFNASVYYTAMWCLKASLLLFFYKLFPDDMPVLRFAMHGVAIFTAAAYIIAVFLNLFACDPITRNWDAARPDNVCLSYNLPIPYYVSGGLHLFTNFLIFVLPIFVLHSLNLNRRKKYTAGVLFLLGAICIGTGIGRVSTFAIGTGAPVTVIWRSAEQMCAIIVACAPPLKWLFMALNFHREDITHEMMRRESIRSEEQTDGVEFGTIKLKEVRWRRKRTESTSTFGESHVSAPMPEQSQAGAAGRRKKRRSTTFSRISNRLLGMPIVEDNVVEDLEKVFTHDTLGSVPGPRQSGVPYREPARKSSEALVMSPRAIGSRGSMKSPTPTRPDKPQQEETGDVIEGSGSLSPRGIGEVRSAAGKLLRERNQPRRAGSSTEGRGLLSAKGNETRDTPQRPSASDTRDPEEAMGGNIKSEGGPETVDPGGASQEKADKIEEG